MTTAESTMKVYLSNLFTVAKLLGHSVIPEDNGKWLEDADSIIGKMRGIKNLNTRKNKLNALIVYANVWKLSPEVIQKYADEVEKIGEAINAELQTHQKNEKQKENWMSKEELVEFANNLKDSVPSKIKAFSDYERMIQYLLVIFHIHYPLRNDLSDAKIYLAADKPNLEGDFNFILINKRKKTAQLILKKYKTSKVYGIKRIDLNPVVSGALIKYFPSIIKFSPDRFLLVKESKDGTEPVSRNYYTKFLLRTFRKTGKQISSTMIRHSIVSDVYKIDKQTQLADVMGHSVATAQQIYAKMDDE
jgi:hypothetical protein